jgi:hypothetical protein
MLNKIQEVANELISLLDGCSDHQFVDYVIYCINNNLEVDYNKYIHNECIQDVLDCIKYGQEG